MATDEVGGVLIIIDYCDSRSWVTFEHCIKKEFGLGAGFEHALYLSDVSRYLWHEL